MRRILAELESNPEREVVELARALDVSQFTQPWHNLLATLKRMEARGMLEVVDEWQPDPYFPNRGRSVLVVRLLPAGVPSSGAA